MSTFLVRLESAMEKAGFKTFAEVANAANLNPNSISRWISEDRIPERGASRYLVAKVLNVDPEWLRTGEGSMERKNGPSITINAEFMNETIEACNIDDVAEAAEFAETFCALFGLSEVSERGKLVIALSALKMKNALNASSIQSLPKKNLGVFTQDMLSRYESGLLK